VAERFLTLTGLVFKKLWALLGPLVLALWAKSGRDMSDTDRAVMEALSGGVKGDGMDVPASDEEALMELLLQRKAKDRAMEVDAMKSGARGFAKGGAVKKAKRSMGKKSRNGCVMAGRGGKYKGTK
jgi:hypothetical protein